MANIKEEIIDGKLIIIIDVSGLKRGDSIRRRTNFSIDARIDNHSLYLDIERKD